jgi:hypothetical protein
MATHEGGAYFEAQLPDGSSVAGAARDEAHARRVIASMQDGQGYPCDHCAAVVGFDLALRRWTHRYGGDVRCYPPKPEPTAWPAPPVTRDRPFRRGLWGCEQFERMRTAVLFCVVLPSLLVSGALVFSVVRSLMVSCGGCRGGRILSVPGSSLRV